MIIPSTHLHRYSRTLSFPIDILNEKGFNVAYTVSQESFEQMAELGVIIGVGNWKRLKHVRLSRPAGTLEDLRLKLRHVPGQPRFSYTEHLENGARFPMIKRMRQNEGHGTIWDNNLTFEELRHGAMVSPVTREKRAAQQRSAEQSDWVRFLIQSRDV